MDQQQPPGASDAGLYTSILSDPLTDVTRKERLYLLAVSIISITIVKTGLIPTEISTLGVKFEQANQETLLYILALVGLYFLAAFLIYAVADFYTWVSAYQSAGGKAAFQELEARLNREAKRRLQRWRERVTEGSELNSEEQRWRERLTEGSERRIESESSAGRSTSRACYELDQEWLRNAENVDRKDHNSIV